PAPGWRSRHGSPLNLPGQQTALWLPESEIRHGSQGVEAAPWGPADGRTDSRWFSPTAARRAATDNPWARRRGPDNSARYAETKIRCASVRSPGPASPGGHSRRPASDLERIPATSARVPA